MLVLLALASAQDSGGEAEWPTARPEGILATPDWSDYRIYPETARTKEQQGSVTPELLIGANGIPKKCRIVGSSYFPGLDAGTCKLVMKMRFEPARDAAGKP